MENHGQLNSSMMALYWFLITTLFLISSFLEIDFEINISDKKSRLFDLSEVIFKCIKVYTLENDLGEVDTLFLSVITYN